MAYIIHKICTNDLPLVINSVSESILFADNTSVIISSRNFDYFCAVSNLVLSHMIKWFVANNFVINFDKTNIMKFITKNSSHYTLHIDYKEKHTKFLGLQTDNHINCKNTIGQIISKLSGACQ